jgi:hypothetical protein
MPPECPPGAAVTIQQVNEHAWIVTRQVPDTSLKVIAIPIISKLADDPEWEKAELEMARRNTSSVPPFEE